ncbi:hypothetical protein [Bacillus bingmayongensis]|uniref:hypothetical protein n=1 Tax=Bacillus bingmayongensis TaxID=1150157 RepID=UPI0012B55276|nr:hypothetical protein [Bacillus bingmayongensis]MBY0599230.1 hypothetical protein [Bacillus bingmayongensis]
MKMVFEGFRERFVVLFERVAKTFRYIASITSKRWQTIRPTVISIGFSVPLVRIVMVRGEQGIQRMVKTIFEVMFYYGFW